MREDSGTGKCVDAKDRGLVPFNRLHRAPTWEELNPGRRKRPVNRISFSIKPDEDGLKVNIYKEYELIDYFINNNSKLLI
jgi:hypothetical protein